MELYSTTKLKINNSTILKLLAQHNRSSPLQGDMFLNPLVNDRINSLLVKRFLMPLLTQYYTTKYITKKGLFVDGSFSGDKYLVKFPSINKPLPFKADYDNSSLPWSASFNLNNRRAARWLKTPTDMISQYFTWLGVSPKPWLLLLDYPLYLVLPLFKVIKTYIHTHYDTLGLAGRYFVDIDSISGIPPDYLRTQSDDPFQWLTALNSTTYSSTWWAKQFVATFSQFAIVQPPALLTLEQFTLARWLWVTPGASKFSKLFLEDQPVRTKFGAAVSLTDQELLDLVHDAFSGKQDQHIGVFVKPDEASYKRRLIANVPLGGYIIAAYIRYLIESYCTREPGFANLAPSLREKVSLMELLDSGYQVYPLDESAYDYHVTRESWLGFIEFLNYMFPNNTGVAYFSAYFHKAKWIFDGLEGKWIKGMPSGLALTSLLNSWMNYIKQVTILPGHINWACGDDVLAIPYHPISLSQIEEEYSDFGSSANASKNWTSYKYAEYLRVLYSRNGTTGYPARIWGTLLFAYDKSFRAPIDKLNENASLWKQLFDRLGLPMDEKMVAGDLSRAISSKIRGFSTRTALQWLHSPRVHGGFGKLPYNDLVFNWTFENRKSKSYVNSRIRMPRVLENWGSVSLDISTYHYQPNVTTHLGRPYVLPPIDSEEEWIARLNREDLPDRGPFTSMLLDTVPLPVVDFISIANMSNYAKTNLFNVYPNLSGSWNVIASRLIKLSYNLVESISMFMATHKLISLV